MLHVLDKVGFKKKQHKQFFVVVELTIIETSFSLSSLLSSFSSFSSLSSLSLSLLSPVQHAHTQTGMHLNDTVNAGQREKGHDESSGASTPASRYFSGHSMEQVSAAPPAAPARARTPASSSRGVLRASQE